MTDKFRATLEAEWYNGNVSQAAYDRLLEAGQSPTIPVPRIRVFPQGLPHGRALHKVVCRITNWTSGKFGEWDNLTDDQREWWVQQVAFFDGFAVQFVLEDAASKR